MNQQQQVNPAIHFVSVTPVENAVQGIFEIMDAEARRILFHPNHIAAYGQVKGEVIMAFIQANTRILHLRDSIIAESNKTEFLTRQQLLGTERELNEARNQLTKKMTIYQRNLLNEKIQKLEDRVTELNGNLNGGNYRPNRDANLLIDPLNNLAVGN